MMNSPAAAGTAEAPAGDWDPDVLDSLERESAVLVRNFELLRRRTSGYASLDQAEYLLLRTATELGSPDINALACAVGVDPSTAGRQVGAMADAGLVRREPDPADRRRCVIAPTEEGAARMAAERSRREDNLGELLADWSPDERRTLAEMFGKYNKAVTERHIKTARR
jgi:DNA-binding MarR family transcriptional regulator